MEQTKELDEFEKKLEEQIIILQNCQEKMQVSSCRKCDKFIKCEVRASYVSAVYQSMNKGSSGGFEF